MSGGLSCTTAPHSSALYGLARSKPLITAMPLVPAGAAVAVDGTICSSGCANAPFGWAVKAISLGVADATQPTVMCRLPLLLAALIDASSTGNWTLLLAQTPGPLNSAASVRVPGGSARLSK